VEPGQLAQCGSGDLDIAPGDLVTLGGLRQVLEQQGEPRLVGVEGGEQQARVATSHPVGQLGVEADLHLVGPHQLASGVALLVLR
jgi:hypothetical protein